MAEECGNFGRGEVRERDSTLMSRGRAALSSSHPSSDRPALVDTSYEYTAIFRHLARSIVMSSASATVRLSDELLVEIFEHLLAARGEGSPKLGVPLLLVCKLWKVRIRYNLNACVLTLYQTVARPLLIQHISFTHASQFARVAERLEIDASQESSLGRHIRIINVAVSQPQGESDDGGDSSPRGPLSIPVNMDLLRVVCRAEFLRSFVMRNICRPSLLSILSFLPSSSSIQELDIYLDTTHMPNETLHSVTENLNRLHDIRVLRLTCYEDWPTAQTPGLRLPQLRCFEWRTRVIASFLDQCQMERLAELTIIDNSDEEVTPECLLSIEHFIRRSSSLHSLALSIEDPQYPPLIGRLPSNITTLDFVQLSFNEEILYPLSPSIHTLRVSVTSAATDGVWRVLRQLFTEETNIQTIFINLWSATDQVVLPFSWVSGLAAMRSLEPASFDLAMLSGRLLACSSELSRKGIEVVDTQGRTASVHLRNR
jgi:hypothetical protein